MSVKSSKPSTTRQSAGLKMSETFSGSCAVIDPILRCPHVARGVAQVLLGRCLRLWHGLPGHIRRPGPRVCGPGLSI